MYFQPEPRLIPQPGGTYALSVQAWVPSSCYAPGPLTPGRIAIPEVLLFTFQIDHRPDPFCLEFPHYVAASVAGVKPGGHVGVMVQSVVDGHVGGEAFIAFPPADKLASLATGTSPGHIIPGTAHAVVTPGLGGPPATLHVTALVGTPTPGYQAKLEPVNPQGFDPAILLLRLILTDPDGPVIQNPSTVLARYVDTPYKGHYRAVTILNGSQSVTVPVTVIFSVFDPAQKHEFSTAGGWISSG